MTQRPFDGYNRRALVAPDPELTEVGPGTPCGDLTRRYCQPAALVDELAGPRPVKPVRLLGENLVLFRDEQGRYGLLERLFEPGLFATPMMAGLPPEVQTSLGESVPYPSRLGEPDEFAALVLHICANRMLNGEAIRLDGALRMSPR